MNKVLKFSIPLKGPHFNGFSSLRLVFSWQKLRKSVKMRTPNFIFLCFVTYAFEQRRNLYVSWKLREIISFKSLELNRADISRLGNTLSDAKVVFAPRNQSPSAQGCIYETVFSVTLCAYFYIVGGNMFGAKWQISWVKGLIWIPRCEIKLSFFQNSGFMGSQQGRHFNGFWSQRLL